MKALLLTPCALVVLGSGMAAAKEKGACGDGNGVQAVIASAATGAVVGSGLARGIVVYARPFSYADDKLIRMPYGAGLLAEPNGQRFVLLKGDDVHLYSFHTFKRLKKTSAKAIKDQGLDAARWIDGSDEVVAFSSVTKSGMFGMSQKTTPYLVRFNVTTGAGSALALEIPKEFVAGAIDERGERVAVAFRDGHVEVRSARDGAALASYRGHEGAAWNGMGLAFHPSENLLASSDGSRLVYFDLDKKAIRSVHPTQDGGRFLQFVADARFFIAADTVKLSLLDREGRTLETGQSEALESLYVADPLRKVFSSGGDLACWRTFERWENTPVVAGAAAADVSLRGVPLTETLERLTSGDAKTRLDAVYAIEKIGPPAHAAVPELVRLSSSADWLTRLGAIRALGAIGPSAKEALPALAALAKDDDEELRNAAEQALSRIAKPPAARAPAVSAGEVMYKGKPLRHYVRQLDDEDFTTRLFAYSALDAIGPAAAAAVPALLAVLEGKEPARKDGEPSLKGAAIASLGAIGPAAAPAVPSIARALSSDDVELRRAAAKSLARIGPAAKEAVPALIAALSEPVMDVRTAVMQALGEIGPDARAAVPALKVLKKDKLNWVRVYAGAALEKIEK
jgi:HEAT repeat protein